jgi:hypothetical protein
VDALRVLPDRGVGLQDARGHHEEAGRAEAALQYACSAEKARWSGWGSPSGPASPSTVRTELPSHCTASLTQDRTASPIHQHRAGPADAVFAARADRVPVTPVVCTSAPAPPPPAPGARPWVPSERGRRYRGAGRRRSPRRWWGFRSLTAVHRPASTDCRRSAGTLPARRSSTVRKSSTCL